MTGSCMWVSATGMGPRGGQDDGGFGEGERSLARLALVEHSADPVRESDDHVRDERDGGDQRERQAGRGGRTGQAEHGTYKGGEDDYRACDVGEDSHLSERPGCPVGRHDDDPTFALLDCACWLAEDRVGPRRRGSRLLGDAGRQRDARRGLLLVRALAPPKATGPTGANGSRRSPRSARTEPRRAATARHALASV